MILGTYTSKLDASGRVIVPRELMDRLNANAFWLSQDPYGVRLSLFHPSETSWRVHPRPVSVGSPSRRIVIPKLLRRGVGLVPGDLVHFVETEYSTLIVPPHRWIGCLESLEKEVIQEQVRAASELYRAARDAAELLRERGLHATATGVRLRKALSHYERLVR